MQLWMSHTTHESTLKVAGEIDVASEPTLRDVLTSLIDTRPAVLHLDLSRVSFLSREGAEVVLDTATACRGIGTTLRLTASRKARRVFDVIGYGNIEEVRDSYELPEEVEKALARALSMN